MKLLGIDLGSREVKVAYMENGAIERLDKYSTMAFYRDYCSYDGRIIVDLDKLGLSNVTTGVSTGYGKNNLDVSDFHKINEIKAHVYGAMMQTGMKDFIMLDVGGQDIKIVRVEGGLSTDLDLNEKCAASCGRYLENMASVLEVPIEEMFSHSDDPVELNSTCAVFSESELIGKIAEGIHVDRLCAGVNYSLYMRLRPMLTKFRGENLVLTGGVARNGALVKFLKNDYETVTVVDRPEFNGAIGCLYYAIISGRQSSDGLKRR